MKKLLLAALLAATAPLAGAVDLLWAKVVAQHQLADKWVAEDNTTTYDVRGNDVDKAGKVKSHLSAWDKGKPLYKIVSVEPKPEPGKPVEGVPKEGDYSNYNVSANELFKLDAKVTRLNNQKLHGKEWAVFQVKEDKGAADFDLRAFVDPVTGDLHQLLTKVHAIMIVDVDMVTSYSPHPKAGAVPHSVELDIKMRIPFKRVDVHLVTALENYIEKPAGAK